MVLGIRVDLAGYEATVPVSASPAPPDTDTDTDTEPPWGLDARPSNTTCLAGAFPEWLSETGCVDPGAPWVPASGVLAYQVRHPLWSDGADKRRWFALPDGETIAPDPVTGDWDLPVGSVAMKEFSLDGQRVQTRLLARTAQDAWEGVSYVWEADGLDARKGEGNIDVGGTTWWVPGPKDCDKCHTAGAGHFLGLEQVQLDGAFRYPGTGRTANQVETLMHIGVLDGRVDVRPLPGRGSAASREDVGRAYLHVNCSHCHRPDEEGKYDLRWTTPFADQGLCDAIGVYRRRLSSRPHHGARPLRRRRAGTIDCPAAARGVPPLHSVQRGGAP